MIGCGYLGAVHAASMAELGHEVAGIDVDQEKIDALSQARTPFFEPGFEELLARTLQTGRLRFAARTSSSAGLGSDGRSTQIFPIRTHSTALRSS